MNTRYLMYVHHYPKNNKKSIRTEDRDMETTPTPYERTLQQDEIQELWKQIQEHWDTNGNGWYPITGSDMPLTVLAFEDAWFYHEIPSDVLKKILKTHGITRVWELREGHASGYEMDTELIDLYYDGTEGYWTSESMD
ncbi:hypothetical protein ccbrp13_10610 [Ktedonobacteria bacterium brp13]|nr:hypothetical protein ccbrp13_10610 [Ktedonobacteria bacterium brp13]